MKLTDQNYFAVTGVATLLALIANCAQTKQSGTGVKKDSMEIISAECPDTMAVGEDAQGLFIVDTFKNRTTNNPNQLQTVARGLIAKDTSKSQLYYACLGLKAFPGRRKKDHPDCSSVPLSDLGGTIAFNLGEAAPLEALDQVGSSATATTELFQMIQPIKNNAGGDPLTLVLSKRNGGLYYSDFKDPLAFPLDDARQGHAATLPAGGVQHLKSFALQKAGANNLNLALSVPGDVEDADHPLTGTISGVIGKPLEIPVAADPAPPKGLIKAAISVFIEEYKPNGAATWDRLCTVPDTGKPVVLQIPTEGKDTKGAAFSMKEGNVTVIVKRRYLSASSLGADAGKIYMEAGAGVIQFGHIDPKPKATP